jgi:hypothetical protein
MRFLVICRSSIFTLQFELIGIEHFHGNGKQKWPYHFATSFSCLISTGGGGVHKYAVDIPLYYQMVGAPATRVTSFVFTDVWTELEYKYDKCRATRGASSEHRYTLIISHKNWSHNILNIFTFHFCASCSLSGLTFISSVFLCIHPAYTNSGRRWSGLVRLR